METSIVVQETLRLLQS